MTDRTAWDRAVAEWTSASMIREAAEKFGPGYRLGETEMLNECILEQKYGKRDGARPGTEARAAYDAEFERSSTELEKYWGAYRDPALEAAQRLLTTPAPDFEALRLKIDIVTEEELQCYGGTENAFDYVQADAQRLAA